MKLKGNVRRRVGFVAGSTVLVCALSLSSAGAAVTNVASSSTVLDVGLKVFGIPNPVVLELLPAAGSAPPAYDVTNALASYSTTIGELSVAFGILSDTASGDIVTGLGSASSTLASLNIAYDSLFTLSATAVSSTSSVDPSPLAVGFTSLADLSITAFGSSISIPINPSIDDVIFDFGGIKVTLNQQILGFGSIVTNAIAIDLSGFLPVHGHIDIAQSEASIETAVPETSTWVMMALGFGGAALIAARRARKLRAVGSSI